MPSTPDSTAALCWCGEDVPCTLHDDEAVWEDDDDDE
jgi:hypothetical protein